MKTPICDFVKRYSENGFARFHMPGHKGRGSFGVENLDITEIQGADVLYGAEGIIAESENNATELFGSGHTFYSTEGSTLCIKAMLALACLDGERRGGGILAARNVHKAFVYACALLDADISWLMPKQGSHICRADISAEDVEKALEALNERNALPSAVYVTSPDYLGNVLDIKGIAEACHGYGVPLLVDNAHGAYLAFTEHSAHPLALGADMCCDSAHKTLPVLTGGAYLHISRGAPSAFAENARRRLSMFASTSPSYLILQSLDRCNGVLSDGYSDRLRRMIRRIDLLKARLRAYGYCLTGDEPMKITVCAAASGIDGERLGKMLREKGIEPEMCDSEYLVLMPGVDSSSSELTKLENALAEIVGNISVGRINNAQTPPMQPIRELSVREAVFSRHERVAVTESEGRICASPTVSCPPAVPIAVSGERVTSETVRELLRYGIEYIDVVKDKTEAL